MEPPYSNTRLYIAFADEDKPALESLLTHLSVLQNNYPFQIWQKDLVPPGTDIEQTSEKELQQAQIVLLLISSHFLAAKWFGELTSALNKLPKIKVVPVIVKACAWKEDAYLKRLKVLPADETPLLSRRGGAKDEAFLEVANGIKSLIIPLEGMPEERLDINQPARPRKKIKLFPILGSIIGAVALIAGLYNEFPPMWRDLMSWIFPSAQKVEASKSSFFPIFQPNDKKTFNVLIIRFEDNITSRPTECIGRSILEHLNVMKEDKDLILPLRPVYVHDTIPPPEDKDQALRIQKRHNADLIIYGLATMEEHCAGVDICFRYAISDDVVSNVAPEIEAPIASHKIDYVQTSPMSIQEGKFKVDAVSMKSWISALMNVKAGKEEAAFLELYKLGNTEASVSKEIRAEKFLARGHAFLDLGRHSKAIEAFNKAIKLNPDNADAYNDRGIAYDNLKAYDQAIRDYDKAIELNPGHAYAYNNRGVVYDDLKVYDQAIRDCDKASKLNPVDADIYNNLGMVYFHVKAYNQAIQAYDKAINLSPDDANVYSDRGAAYLDLQAYDQAIRDCNKAIELDPDHANAYYNRGTSYSKLKAYDQAVRDFDKAIELNPNNIITYNNRGIVYRQLKAYDKAIRDYNKAIKLNPNDTAAYLNRGNVYFDLKIYDKAIRDYYKAIEMGTEDFLAYFQLGFIYDDLKDYQQAIWAYGKAIELNPDDADVYNNRGIVYRQLKDYNKAIRDYNKAIELNPDDADVYFNRGSVYFDLKEYDKAIRDYNKAIDINPSNFNVYGMIVRIYILSKYWYLTLITLLTLVFLFRKRLKSFILKVFKKMKHFHHSKRVRQ